MAQTTPRDGGPYHLPVMAGEVVDLFAPISDGLLVDGTFGGGGHSLALLAAYPRLEILGLDRDPDALERAPGRQRLRLVRANFADLSQVLERELGSGDGDGPLVDGVFLDLGVSSYQLDTAERGFSYHERGPLDMRMGPDAAVAAAEVVNEWDERALELAIRRYGEERYAKRIAAAIVRKRPITDTADLSAIIAAAVPAAARRQRHPARKTFQAIRIAVNEELAAVERGLDAAIESLAVGGRIVVIAYHSLEDRLVKRRFVAGATGCVCPPDLPVCGCDAAAELRLLTRKPLRPMAEEIAANPRARSARLRAAERVAA